MTSIWAEVTSIWAEVAEVTSRGDEQISLDFRNNHPHARFQERIVEKRVGWLAKDLALK